MTRVSATEAARSFSEVLSRVAAGEEIEVTRGGVPVATIGPPKTQVMSAQRFRELMASLPAADEDFASDLRALREDVGPPSGPWPS